MNVFEIEKHTWPATGIREDTTIEDYDWGYLYLYLYPDGRLPEFRLTEKPSEPEIRARWGYYLK